jgi:hypothetical protein
VDLHTREAVVKRCSECGGKFGLIRYTAYRLLGGILQFCKKSCERAHYDRVRRDAHYISWLYTKP